MTNDRELRTKPSGKGGAWRGFSLRRHSNAGLTTAAYEHKSGAVSVFPRGSISYQGPAHQLILDITPQYLLAGLDRAVHGGTLELREERGFNDPRIEHLMHALDLDLREDCPEGPLYSELLVQAIAVYVAQRYSVRPAATSALNFGMPKARLNRVLGYIEENLGESIRLPQLAAAAGMTMYHFAKLFKKSTGESPHQYLIRRRIETAQQLLREREMSVLEVSARTGFVDQRHFAKVFRRMTGLTPTAYRTAL